MTKCPPTLARGLNRWNAPHSRAAAIIARRDYSLATPSRA
jgi:hypothetical protein